MFAARTVESLCVGGNEGEEGGVIVKFAIVGTKTTETAVLTRRASQALVAALGQAAQAGLIKPISDEDRKAYAAKMPRIESYDWNLQSQPGRMVRGMEIRQAAQSLQFDLTMGDGVHRLYLIDFKLLQFLGEYLFAYRKCIDWAGGQ